MAVLRAGGGCENFVNEKCKYVNLKACNESSVQTRT